MPYAEVTISTLVPFAQAFSYAVSDGLVLSPGDAVLAPFGARLLPGVVVSMGDRPAFDGELRTIETRLGDESLIDTHHIALARWLADRYLAPFPTALSLMLPRGARDPADFLPPVPPAMHALRLEISAESALKTLAFAAPAIAGRALRSVAALIDAGGIVPIAELRSSHLLTNAVEKLLVSTGIVCAVETAHITAKPEPRLQRAEPAAVLTDDQQRAVAAIELSMRRRFAGHDAPGSFLLHGVTGSGKTEVYLAALDIARRYGRQGIVLVPEIALTPQTLDRFSRRFPGRVAVVHGRLTRARHRAQWFGARAGEFDVVIGARSAIFAPLQRIGLIVMDEEHEPSYKQSDPAPRYHAREVAAELARLTDAVLVLGSATPDAGSYRRAMDGEHRLLALPKRVAGVADGTAGERPLPSLTVVDMARELREGHQRVLSRPLEADIEAALAAGEQTLLFLNRRGSASLLLCRECGYTPRCPRCSVAYALHASEGKLVCHLCHHSRKAFERCPKCRGARIRPVGIGTQRLEELVRHRFPEARVVRWDSDTANTSTRHAELARLIAHHEADIVVGTQMVAKGHDFPHMTVVGVVSADLSLNVPDFRAAERTFQLLVQVAGRAGRRDVPGKVVVQTYSPRHYAIALAAEQNYAGFMNRELGFRRQFSYPPFGALSRLVYAHTRPELAERGAKRYGDLLRSERERLGLPGPHVIGPAPCYFSKVGGRWRWQVLLLGPGAHELLSAVTPPAQWSIDVEPGELL